MQEIVYQILSYYLNYIEYLGNDYGLNKVHDLSIEYETLLYLV